jgi:hypothetical protein
MRARHLEGEAALAPADLPSQGKRSRRPATFRLSEQARPLRTRACPISGSTANVRRDASAESSTLPARRALHEPDHPGATGSMTPRRSLEAKCCASHADVAPSRRSRGRGSRKASPFGACRRRAGPESHPPASRGRPHGIASPPGRAATHLAVPSRARAARTARTTRRRQAPRADPGAATRRAEGDRQPHGVLQPLTAAHPPQPLSRCAIQRRPTPRGISAPFRTAATSARPAHACTPTQLLRFGS